MMAARAGVILARVARLVVALGCIAGGIGLESCWPDNTFELQTLDLRFRLRGPVPPGHEVALVVADDRTVAGVGRWPLPRDVIADAVRRLAAAGAAVVVLDLLLLEPAAEIDPQLRSAIEATRSQLPDGSPERTQLDRALARADLDRDLAAAMTSADRVVLPFALAFGPAPSPVREPPAVVSATAFPIYAELIGQSGSAAERPTGLLVPTPTLATAAKSLGHVSLLVDRDGAARAELPVVAYADELLPSLPVETVRLFAGIKRQDMLVRLGQGVQIGPYWLPTDARMRHHVNFYGPPGTIETRSLMDVLDGSLATGSLEHRIVLLGASAAGTGDTFRTPFNARLPGVEFLATSVENILQGRSLIRDARTTAFDTLGILILGTLGATLSGRRSLAWSAGVTAVLVGAWLAIALVAFISRNWWLAVVAPCGTAVAAAAIVEGIRITAEQRRRRRLERQRANLARYFPPLIVDRLAEQTRSLEGMQSAAVMFVDIIDSTRLTERLGASAAMAVLREFHERVERAVFAHGGMVDKFMGDGAMACFGVPDADPEAAAQALRTARALQDDLQHWAAARSQRGLQPVLAGVGVHYGTVLMGNIGGNRQFQFTVVGDTVNVASRLEGMTRQQRAQIIMSDDAMVATQAAAPDDSGLLAGFEPLPAARLRGREEPIKVWRLARPPGAPTPSP
jgi:adenylate cyclase